MSNYTIVIKGSACIGDSRADINTSFDNLDVGLTAAVATLATINTNISNTFSINKLNATGNVSVSSVSISNATSVIPTGSIVNSFPIYDVSGNLLGYVPIYDSL